MAECITLKYNIWVSKEDVRKAIKEIDPEGVDRQRRKVIHRRVCESLGPGHIYQVQGIYGGLISLIEGVHRPQPEACVECLLFCFLAITQLELNDVVTTCHMRQ